MGKKTGLLAKLGVDVETWRKKIFPALAKAAHIIAKRLKEEGKCFDYRRQCYRMAWEKIKRVLYTAGHEIARMTPAEIVSYVQASV